MKVKKIENFHYLLVAVLALTATLGLVSFVIIQSRAAGSTTSAGVDNEIPTVSAAYFAESTGGSTTIDPVVLIAGTTTTFYANGTIRDGNGCEDIATTAKVYVHLNGTECNDPGDADRNNCYVDESCTVDKSETECDTVTPDPGDLTVPFECTIALDYFSDGTDANSGLTGPTDYWVMDVIPIDATGDGTTNSSTTFDVGTTLALDLDSAIIRYESDSLGVDAGIVALGTTSDEASLKIYNYGNDVMDFEVYGVDMGCSALGTIDADLQEFSLSTGFSYSAGTDLPYTGSAATVAAVVNPRDDDNSGNSYLYSSASDGFDYLYWLISLPSSGLSGTCTGTNTLTAVAN